mmetsp:Transcript_45361/g.119076  ORF Transcript_45361/g.119076 Transcript_45361/m.119076 type:complete len:254 (+) Transcript_45361:1688-2449(+)
MGRLHVLLVSHLLIVRALHLGRWIAAEGHDRERIPRVGQLQHVDERRVEVRLPIVELALLDLDLRGECARDDTFLLLQRLDQHLFDVLLQPLVLHPLDPCLALLETLLWHGLPPDELLRLRRLFALDGILLAELHHVCLVVLELVLPLDQIELAPLPRLEKVVVLALLAALDDVLVELEALHGAKIDAAKIHHRHPADGDEADRVIVLKVFVHADGEEENVNVRDQQGEHDDDLERSLTLHEAIDSRVDAVAA